MFDGTTRRILPQHATRFRPASSRDGDGAGDTRLRVAAYQRRTPQHVMAPGGLHEAGLHAVRCTRHARAAAAGAVFSGRRRYFHELRLLLYATLATFLAPVVRRQRCGDARQDKLRLAHRLGDCKSCHDDDMPCFNGL